MKTYEVSLIEWPDGPHRGGPRLLARSEDRDLVELVRGRLIAEQRRELTRLRGPQLRPICTPDSEGSD